MGQGEKWHLRSTGYGRGAHLHGSGGSPDRELDVRVREPGLCRSEVFLEIRLVVYDLPRWSLVFGDALQSLLVILDRPMRGACAIRSRTLHPVWASNAIEEDRVHSPFETIAHPTHDIAPGSSQNPAAWCRLLELLVSPREDPAIDSGRSILTGEGECRDSADVSQLTKHSPK